MNAMKLYIENVNEMRKEVVDEGGWWNGNEIIVVEQESKIETLKVLVHELIEWYLENEMGYEHENAHIVALRMERCIDEIV